MICKGITVCELCGYDVKSDWDLTLAFNLLICRDCFATNGN